MNEFELNWPYHVISPFPAAHRLQVLDVEELITQAIDAYKNGEVEHREAVSVDL